MTDEPASDNRVFLHGRLAEAARERELPSGDILTTFRLVVDRPAGDRGRVDTLDCVTTVSRVRRSLAKAAAGDWLEISGSLRRRFWRGPAGVASRYAVEVATLRVTRRAVPPAGSAAGRATAAAPTRKRASA